VEAHREQREAFVDDLIADMVIYPVTAGIARMAGGISGQLGRRGFTVPFEDLLIGATALHQAASWVRCGYREHPAFRNDSWSRGEEALFTCGV